MRELFRIKSKDIILLSLCSILFGSCYKSEHLLPSHCITDILANVPDSEFVAIHCDKDWEKELSFPCIITTKDGFLMYYGTYTGLEGNRYFALCIGKSDDGIKWYKPNLNIVDYNGDYNNNILIYGVEGCCVEVINDVYYMICMSAKDITTRLYKSKDGLYFERVDSFDLPYCCDSQNQILYNNKNDEILMYLRCWYKSDNKNIIYSRKDSLLRNVAYTLTKDIEKFSITQNNNDSFYLWGKNNLPALSTDLPMIFDKNQSSIDYDYYNPCIHKYGDGLYIAYPTLYYHYKDIENDGYGVIAQYISEDGQHFTCLNANYINYDKWCEFGIGHVENEEYFIHYWLPFPTTHNALPSKNKIIGRIHKK